MLIGAKTQFLDNSIYISKYPILLDNFFIAVQPLFCHFFEAVSGFESRDVVSRNNYGDVLAYVAGSLFGSLLDYERTESTEINIFAVCETVFHNCHKLFNNGNNSSLVDSGCLRDFTRYFCFSHFFAVLKICDK